MQLDLESCGVRSFRESDAAELARHANNRDVWRQLRDRFPHPYSTDDARGFIAFARGANPETAFAVTVDDRPVGSIGAVLGEDVERCSAEVGYWLGERYWGRGIATLALVGFTGYAFAAYGLERLFAVPLAANTASCRVLEKVGYRLEGRMRRSAVKGGVVQDQLLYAILRGDDYGSAKPNDHAATPAQQGPQSEERSVTPEARFCLAVPADWNRLSRELQVEGVRTQIC